MTREEKISRLKDIFSEINENDNAVCYLTSEDNELIESAIEALSQEPCYNPDEWCHDCSEYNQDKHCCPRFNNVIRNAVEEMKQPCEDTISRSETIKYLNINMAWYDEDGWIIDGKEKLKAITDLINGVPPVTPQPKTGHWINIDETHSKCDRCGAVFEIASENGEANYCPNCGARMVEPQKSEAQDEVQ
jgi:predicted  nucleic acid-binding Zn-ribbon protein